MISNQPTRGDVIITDNEGNDLLNNYFDEITTEINSNVKTFFVDTVAPTGNDDVTRGAVQGSEWLDTTLQKVHKCFDNTEGSAVWVVLN